MKIKKIKIGLINLSDKPKIVPPSKQQKKNFVNFRFNKNLKKKD